MIAPKERGMKLLVIGSRSIRDFDISPYVPADTDMIISGGAVGIDTIAEAYADKHRLSKLILRPTYGKYGRAAPLKRNEAMIREADRLLVIWDGVSKGTYHSIQYAKKLDKDISVIIAPAEEDR